MFQITEEYVGLNPAALLAIRGCRAGYAEDPFIKRALKEARYCKIKITVKDERTGSTVRASAPFLHIWSRK